MKRPVLPFAMGLALAAAAFTLHQAPAGEQPPPGPRPGLEIFDGAATVPLDAGREGEDMYSDPYGDPPVTQPPYQPPTLARPQVPPPEESRQPDPGMGDGGTTYDPFIYTEPAPDSSSDPYADPYAQPQGNIYRDPNADPYADPGTEVRPGPAADGVGQDIVPPPDPVASVLDNLNRNNRNFPGLGEAAAQGNLQGAGNIIWDVLRQRRIVDATMTRGVRGSVGAPSPYDMQRFVDAVSQNPQGYEDPLMAAARINTILDSFHLPVVDDMNFGGYMPQALTRLNEDIHNVRYTMAQFTDDGMFLELARTYIRAVTTCDFFAFPKRALAVDVKDIMTRGSGMFYPDGSSRGGDVAGVTGNLFQIMLMLDYYTRDDSWFRRDLGSVWRVMERPSHFLLDVACPDYTLPRYGPRGSRELGTHEVAAVEAIFPRQPPRINRIGLAATTSYPLISTTDSYAGVYVIQNATPTGDRYMAVRFGPWGDLSDVPIHNDFGSIVMWSKGVKYMVDAGGYGGRSASAQAHGGLSLNGKYVVEGTLNQPGTKADAVWRTNASIDYVTDMAGYDDGKTWQRSVLYVKPLPGETRTDYWMVLDHADMKGDPNPHEARIRFQLAPGVQAYHDGSGIMASGGTDGSGVRFFAVDAGARMEVMDGNWGEVTSQLFDAAGGSISAPSVNITRNITGDSTTATVVYPSDAWNHRPLRIQRDADVIRGRTGAIIIDHGMERVDVVAWAPPGTELVTPTLNLQLSADLAVFRLRRGKITRIDFVNLERFQAKEPDGGLWSMRVNGPAQTLTLEPERSGGWQVLADPANRGAADFFDVNFGPTVNRTKFSIRPGEMRVVSR